MRYLLNSINTAGWLGLAWALNWLDFSIPVLIPFLVVTLLITGGNIGLNIGLSALGVRVNKLTFVPIIAVKSYPLWLLFSAIELWPEFRLNLMAFWWQGFALCALIALVRPVNEPNAASAVKA